MRIGCAIAAAAVILSASVPVYADMELKAEGQLLTVSGGGAGGGEETVLIMLKKGISAQAYKKEPKDSMIEYFWQTIADSDGAWVFNIYLDSSMEYGEYAVLVGDGKYAEEDVYVHVAEKDRPKNTLIQKLNKCKNADEIKTLLKDNSSAFDLGGSISEAQWNSIALTLLNNAGSFTLNNIDSYVNTAKAASAEKPVSGGGGGGGSSGGSSVVRGTVQAAGEQSDTQGSVRTESLFSDVPQTHYAYSAITALYNKGILSGVDDKKFEPDRAVKREEFAHMLVNAFNISGDAVPTFEDVKPDAWYYNSVRKCFAAGIITGYSEKVFGVGDTITREDACVMLYRMTGAQAGTANISVYTDVDAVSDYAADAITALSSAGLVSGMGDGSFAPKANLTRAQAAVVLYNILKSR